jgi:hypothetical protein
MRRYAAIHVGTRWTATHPWGVMYESDSPRVRDLLCVGCSEQGAEEMAERLNGQIALGERTAKEQPARVEQPARTEQPAKPEQKAKKRNRWAGWFHVLLVVALCGCATVKPLKPGTATIRAGTATNGLAEFVSEMKQPENPAQSAMQSFERVSETELPMAAGSRVVETTRSQDAAGQPVVREKTYVLPEPTIQKTRVTEKAGTTIGAAQKDTAREIGAKLASLKSVMWVGVALFAFGLASMFYPPLKLAIGSVTTSAAIAAGGLVLMVLPTMVVGNELLILGAVALAVGGWFVAHRHGQLRGMVEGKRNGVDDRLENGKPGEQ